MSECGPPAGECHELRLQAARECPGGLLLRAEARAEGGARRKELDDKALQRPGIHVSHQAVDADTLPGQGRHRQSIHV